MGQRGLSPLPREDHEGAQRRLRPPFVWQWGRTFLTHAAPHEAGRIHAPPTSDRGSNARRRGVPSLRVGAP